MNVWKRVSHALRASARAWNSLFGNSESGGIVHCSIDLAAVRAVARRANVSTRLLFDAIDRARDPEPNRVPAATRLAWKRADEAAAAAESGAALLVL